MPTDSLKIYIRLSNPSIGPKMLCKRVVKCKTAIVLTLLK